MDDSQQQVKLAVEAALQNAGHALVRVGSASHKADIAAATGSFALVGLDGERAREVHVALRLPSQAEVMTQVAEQLQEQGVQAEGQAMTAAQDMLEPYFQGGAAKAWLSRVQHGDTVIVFEGVPHNSDHVLNRAHADIESGSSRTAGLAETALARWMPDAAETERQAANLPQNRHRLLAVNGCVMLNYQEQDIDLRGKFAHVVELAEAHGAAPDAEARLHPYIRIGTLDGAPTTLRVNNLHQVTCGTGYFAKDDLPPQGALEAALLHEHAHVLNGDLATPELQYVHELGSLSGVKGRAIIGKMHPNLLAKPLLDEAGGDVGRALGQVAAMRADLDAMDTALRPVYEALRDAPWLPQLSGVWAAADMDGENRILGTLRGLPACEAPRAEAVSFSERTAGLLRRPVQDAEPPEADMAQVRGALLDMYAAHEDLMKGLELLAKLGSALNHATEFRADDRAADALGSATGLEAMLRWAKGGGDSSLGSFTHPSIDARAERQQNRPVLGAATAALAQRAIPAPGRGI